MGDAFAAFNKKLNENGASTSRSLTGGKLSSETARQDAGQVEQQTTEVTKIADHPTASERVAQRQQARELKSLQEWVETQRQDPIVDDYLAAHGQKALVDERLDEQKRSKSTAPEAVELLTQLRHRAAVNAKSKPVSAEVLRWATGRWLPTS